MPRTYQRSLQRMRDRVQLLEEAIETIVQARLQMNALDLGPLDVAIDQAVADYKEKQNDRMSIHRRSH
jgi:hypothetical protein